MEKSFPEDRLLAEQLASGDMRAFTLLYEKYHSYLYHFSLKFLKSSEIAEEVVHDVFLKVWESKETIDPSFSLKGYLIKICKNHVLNLIKRELREKEWRTGVFFSQSGYHSDTENAIVWADYEKLAEEGIGLLPPQRQKIFRMYRLEEKRLNEIAETLGISKGTVKDHLLKATRQMRDFMRRHSGAMVDMILLTILFRG